MFDGTNALEICSADGKFNDAEYKNAKNNYDISYTIASKKRIVTYDIINDAVRYCRDNDLLQCIAFVFSQRNCEVYADNTTVKLIKQTDRESNKKEFDKRMRPFKEIYQDLPLYDKVRELVGKGVCYHHSGLPPIFKEIIQEMFRDGHLKVLFATETFAVGVNMPVRTILLTDLTKYSDTGLRSLRPDEFKQICGRAGRRGKDTHGYAIMLPIRSFYDMGDIKELIYGNMPSIVSTMEIGYNSLLKLKQSIVTDVSTFYGMSLRNEQNTVNIVPYVKRFEEIKETIKEYNDVLTDQNINKVKEYFRLDLIASGKASIGGFSMKMNNKDKKKLKSLNGFRKSNTKLFNRYEEYTKLERELSKLSDEIKYLSGDASVERVSGLCKVLHDLGLLTDTYELTAKGIVASQINECDCSPLLVGLFYKILDDYTLTSSEIVGITAVLLEKSRYERDYGMVLGKDLTSADISVLKYTGEYNSKGMVDCTPNMRSVIKSIQEYAHNSQGIEAKHKVCNPESLWDVNMGWIEIAYKWAEGAHIKDICSILEESGDNLGTFIKNMLKIYNILEDLESIANDLHKMELIDVLETAKSSILRSVVNNFSIHIN
jgi:superfamily II RNA helicase